MLGPASENRCLFQERIAMAQANAFFMVGVTETHVEPYAISMLLNWLLLRMSKLLMDLDLSHVELILLTCLQGSYWVHHAFLVAT